MEEVARLVEGEKGHADYDRSLVGNGKGETESIAYTDGYSEKTESMFDVRRSSVTDKIADAISSTAGKYHAWILVALRREWR
ncbi:hypothetical protein PV08_00780 [Exophiala spinifera]|uniref:Uncharacterized protein n=1 Tax=Exophiala spinifera TaxID=91928 RepID=A0A0D2BNV0_9EURO|nr:uncharacterized protein PV08_00780 [Exophiala spinifera]KIW20205.1 hypothetical protein PV08_00780 [Exophiala spinifera]